MPCFSLFVIERLLIWLVVIAAVAAIIRYVLPTVVGPLGPVGNAIVYALNIVLAAVVIIAIIVIVFDLLACVVPLGVR